MQTKLIAMKRLLFFLFLGLAACNSVHHPAYKNASLSVDARVEDLLKRMTLEEKAAQLQSFICNDSSAWDSQGNFTGGKDSSVIYHGAGIVYVIGKPVDPKETVRRMNAIQKYLIEKSRLGIPSFSFAEALHGYMAPGATSFPQAIALGSTWDTALVEQVFTAAALEARSRGVTQVLSPVLDLAREPRWGRTEECYSEDPYLVSRIGMAAVFGLQGREKVIDNRHVIVTLKHFAGHGQPEGGRNIAPVNYSEREFRSNHLYPFEMAVKKANAQSIMASYNEWDGVPNHVNHKLLTDILRDEWGFKGYVMSDGGGMDVVFNDHHAAESYSDAGRLSIIAGLDYDLGGSGCFTKLVEQVKSGEVPQAALDRAVRNVLRVKFTAGLFEHPYVNADTMEMVTNCSAHKSLALKAAQEAMILLKNEKNTLPFDSLKIKNLAVIGPDAADIHLGGYTNPPMKGVSVLEGIRNFAGKRMNVLYAEGCKLTLNKECNWLVNENPIMADQATDDKLIAEAVNVARRSDAVVLVLGENELICREAWSDEHRGDRDNLDLAGHQEQLAKAILATGKPVVALLINGRPITVNYLAQAAPAILECWYLGQETGHAVADVLFGRVSPSGKLTVTIPRSVGQLPCYYDHKPSRFRNYVLADSSPLWPFGFGLSYTTFKYGNLQLQPSEMPVNGKTEVSVDVTNTGKYKADEIVQLYIHDVVSLPTRPVKELKDFARITLNPGETKTVKFTVTPDKLEAFGLNMKREVQPGDFEIMAGGNSSVLLTKVLKVK